MEEATAEQKADTVLTTGCPAAAVAAELGTTTKVSDLAATVLQVKVSLERTRSAVPSVVLEAAAV